MKIIFALFIFSNIFCSSLFSQNNDNNVISLSVLSELPANYNWISLRNNHIKKSVIFIKMKTDRRTKRSDVFRYSLSENVFTKLSEEMTLDNVNLNPIGYLGGNYVYVASDGMFSYGNYYVIDPATLQIELIQFNHHADEVLKAIPVFNYLYITYDIIIDKIESKLHSFNNGIVDQWYYDGSPIAVSADGRYIIYQDIEITEEQEQFSLNRLSMVDLESRNVEYTLNYEKYSYDFYISSNTNLSVLSSNCLLFDLSAKYYIFDFTMDSYTQVQFEINEQKVNDFIVIDQNYAVASVKVSPTVLQYYLVDASALYDWMVQKEMIMPSRPAVISGNTEIRERAILESVILFEVIEGEVVTVLDRSLKALKYGSAEDYWYFIKTESGLRGWIDGEKLEMPGKLREGTR
jgi:hypothetical protein